MISLNYWITCMAVHTRLSAGPQQPIRLGRPWPNQFFQQRINNYFQRTTCRSTYVYQRSFRMFRYMLSVLRMRPLVKQLKQLSKSASIYVTIQAPNCNKAKFSGTRFARTISFYTLAGCTNLNYAATGLECKDAPKFLQVHVLIMKTLLIDEFFASNVL